MIRVKAQTDANRRAIYTVQAIEEYCPTARSFTLHAMFKGMGNLQYIHGSKVNDGRVGVR